jgi:hypothetical protein
LVFGLIWAVGLGFLGFCYRFLKEHKSLWSF